LGGKGWGFVFLKKKKKKFFKKKIFFKKFFPPWGDIKKKGFQKTPLGKIIFQKIFGGEKKSFLKFKRGFPPGFF
jgi:hypothetical protein